MSAKYDLRYFIIVGFKDLFGKRFIFIKKIVNNSSVELDLTSEEKEKALKEMLG